MDGYLLLLVALDLLSKGCNFLGFGSRLLCQPFQALLLPLHLELGHSQMLLGTAALTTLQVCVARRPHGVVEIVLEDGVGFPQNRLAGLCEEGLPVLANCRLGGPLFAHTHLMDSLLHRSHQGRVFAAFRPADFLFHHRDVDHMKVVMVHILPQLFRHGPVPFIGVHHRRENVLLATHDVHSGLVSVLIELLGKFIAAVIIEIGGIHIEDKLTELLRIRFQATGRDGAGGYQTIKHCGVVA